MLTGRSNARNKTSDDLREENPAVDFPNIHFPRLHLAKLGNPILENRRYLHVARQHVDGARL